MNTNNSSNRTARTTNDHQGDCFVKQVCNALDPDVCPLCCQHGNAATEAKKGAGTDAGMDTTATMAPSTEAVNVDTEARRVGTITAKQRRKIDRWLIKAFKLNDFDHLRLLARLPNSTKLYRLLDDARRRGNWQASALWLEMHHPDRWAPRPQNIISIDADNSGKSFRKARKAGVKNGKAK